MGGGGDSTGGSNNNPSGGVGSVSNGGSEFRWLGSNGNPEAISDPCPYPTSVCWWKTLDGKHCAIIGYSDGTICIVGKEEFVYMCILILLKNVFHIGLEPHCPLVAHTSIERGAVIQMVICRDAILNNVTLLVTLH